MKFYKFTNWLFIIVGAISLIYVAIYFARRPQADVVVCNNGIPYSVLELVEDFKSESNLRKFKTTSSQDGQVVVEIDKGQIFGPNSMIVSKDKETFWYLKSNSDTFEIKATITNVCGTSFVKKLVTK